MWAVAPGNPFRVPDADFEEGRALPLTSATGSTLLPWPKGRQVVDSDGIQRPRWRIKAARASRRHLGPPYLDGERRSHDQAGKTAMSKRSGREYQRCFSSEDSLTHGDLP